MVKRASLEMEWWWLSFSEDGNWLGGVVVDAESFTDAIDKAWQKECNPGGGVNGISLGEFEVGQMMPMEPYTLYSREQLDAIGISVEEFGA